MLSRWKPKPCTIEVVLINTLQTWQFAGKGGSAKVNSLFTQRSKPANPNLFPTRDNFVNYTSIGRKFTGKRSRPQTQELSFIFKACCLLQRIIGYISVHISLSRNSRGCDALCSDLSCKIYRVHMYTNQKKPRKLTPCILPCF